MGFRLWPPFVRFSCALALKQALVRLQLLAKSLKGEELARELDIITVLVQHYNVTNNSLLAGMRDGASVNAVATRTVKIVFPKVIDFRCFFYTIDRVGQHSDNIPTVKQFLQQNDWPGRSRPD